MRNEFLPLLEAINEDINKANETASSFNQSKEIEEDIKNITPKLNDINFSNRWAKKSVEEMANAIDRAEEKNLGIVTEILNPLAESSAYWSRYKDDQKRIEKKLDEQIAIRADTSEYFADLKDKRNEARRKAEERKKNNEENSDIKPKNEDTEIWMKFVAEQLGIDITDKTDDEILEEIAKMYEIRVTDTAIITSEDFIHSIIELDQKISEEGWTYGTKGSGNAKNFEKVLNNKLKQLQCGSSVNLGLYLAGFMTVENLTNSRGGFNPHGVGDVHRVVSKNLSDGMAITDINELKKGDILFRKTGAPTWGHVEVVDKVDEKGNVWVYSTGSNYGIGKIGSTNAGKIRDFEAYRLEDKVIQRKRSDDEIKADIENKIIQNQLEGISFEDTAKKMAIKKESTPNAAREELLGIKQKSKFSSTEDIDEEDL